MTPQEFEQKHNVRLLNKKDSWFWRILGRIAPGMLHYFWATYRFPFCKTTVAYPDTVIDPMDPKHIPVVEHELDHHYRWFNKMGGPVATFFVYFLVPFPIIFSGRWFFERTAYLIQINKYGYSIEWAVNTLWKSYIFPWPKPLMRWWFEQHKG